VPRAIALLALLVQASFAAHALDLEVEVRDLQGVPVEDAVVVAIAPVASGAPAEDAVIDQVDKEFIAYVNVVAVGTRVRFPNHDNLRHHVYSFSRAKTFDLPLYRGATAAPVLFDRPGVVVMGCNIHDWMVSYLYVSESPWFARTGKDGRAKVHGPASAPWRVRVWHPRQVGTEQATERSVEPGAADQVSQRWQIELRPDMRPSRAPMPGLDAYR
jgi:plastocyanin